MGRRAAQRASAAARRVARQIGAVPKSRLRSAVRHGQGLQGREREDRRFLHVARLHLVPLARRVGRRFPRPFAFARSRDRRSRRERELCRRTCDVLPTAASHAAVRVRRELPCRHRRVQSRSRQLWPRARGLRASAVCGAPQERRAKRQRRRRRRPHGCSLHAAVCKDRARERALVPALAPAPRARDHSPPRRDPRVRLDCRAARSAGGARATHRRRQDLRRRGRGLRGAAPVHRRDLAVLQSARVRSRLCRARSSHRQGDGRRGPRAPRGPRHCGRRRRASCRGRESRCAAARDRAHVQHPPAAARFLRSRARGRARGGRQRARGPRACAYRRRLAAPLRPRVRLARSPRQGRHARCVSHAHGRALAALRQGAKRLCALCRRGLQRRARRARALRQGPRDSPQHLCLTCPARA
eukprot:Amastigsp_a513289_12.p2 type:complete len:414 gc:universal Amastigsp_a513289_12:1-1242(+)